jgi:hypothetical protein
MFVIPFEVRDDKERGPVVVVMILEKENLDRMKEADPFDVHFRAYRRHMNIHRPIGELDFILAYEEDTNAILEFKRKNDLLGLLCWLERGRKVLPGEPHPPIPYRKN